VRFQLIDRVLERRADKLVVVKNVTSAEEYLADHFPGFAILPGVMMLEVMVQAARILIADPEVKQSNGSGDQFLTDQEKQVDRQQLENSQNSCCMPLVVTEVRNMRYGQMVRPGQSLIVEVTIRDRDDHGYEMAGVGRVEEKVAVQGRFRMAPLGSICESPAKK